MRVAVFWWIVLACSAISLAADDLTVLKPTEGEVAPGQQLERWLKHEFDQLVERRSAAFEKAIKSESGCRAWQDERREFFRRMIGTLPERTPLHAQVVGKIEGKGYRIEKVTLESRPGFRVTGNLYLPTSPAPWPAVLIPCGHSHDGKAVGQYQRISMLLAKHGMAAMCYDPIGQGERYQMIDATQPRETFDEAKHVKVPHPNVTLMCTTEHTMIGLGCALLGSNVAQYRIWDGMRVIDYLQSRPDIIKDRIGCAGNSGGGTETAYLMVLDDRITAASPGCFLTTFKRLMESKGPQDGEQNIFAQIAFGLDEADYCIMRAPKPTLICAGTRDATFDFRGTWELFGEAKRFYSRLGRADAIDINAPDAPHGFVIQQREAVARFMHRYLLGTEKLIHELDTPLPDAVTDQQLWDMSQREWPAEVLQCVPRGQVLLETGERSVFQINAEIASSLCESRANKWKKLDTPGKQQLVRETIGLSTTLQSATSKLEDVGTIKRSGFVIHKLVLKVDDRLRLPGLAFVPDKPSGITTLYLPGASLSADAAPDGPIEKLVKAGQIVLSAELRGIDETETGRGKREFGYGYFGPDNLEILTAYLIGKSYVGMPTEDALHWLRAFQNWVPMPATETHLIGSGEAAIPALHAAALQPDSFRSVQLRRMLSSWEDIVRTPKTLNQSVNVVHGALLHYDLPDLIDLAGREKVHVSETVDALNQLRR